MMEDKEVYTALNLQPKQGGSDGPSPAENQGSRQYPGWLQVALGAGNLIQAVAVLLLAVCVSHLVSQKGPTPTAPGTDGAGSADPSTAECSNRLEHFRSHLSQRLCHPAPPGPAGGPGCKLCPTDWWLRGDKCYWVSRRGEMWSESRADCSVRGSQLLVIRDPQELEFIKDLTQGSNQFWVGLSVSSLEKAWIWVDGSRLDPPLSPVSGLAEGNSCGVLNRNRIRSDTCSSVLRWICQRDAVAL
ncbi:killer cell lectin-like receptor subfamily B member 1 [Malaclemys terrapin pileata]|uniref:killer cell lectin-like receptor subfamily B member 1 n=1 Tax=Malaclemys terrapin pileata TaxID=2991368 RepID=UPI0023A853F4|nr:killer cell lectin-like receptor subfamily B member 1 [Malaclemys terrapin pileata]